MFRLDRLKAVKAKIISKSTTRKENTYRKQKQNILVKRAAISYNAICTVRLFKIIIPYIALNLLKFGEPTAFLIYS